MRIGTPSRNGRVVWIRESRLKDAIERGYEDVAAGRLLILGDDADLDAFFADL